MATAVELEDAWMLSPQVALRPEPFGALAYHFGNRRLTFLKQPSLVSLVRALTDSDTVNQAMKVAQVPAAERPVFLSALQSLADGDMIRPREETDAHA